MLGTVGDGEHSVEFHLTQVEMPTGNICICSVDRKLRQPLWIKVIFKTIASQLSGHPHPLKPILGSVSFISILEGTKPSRILTTMMMWRTETVTALQCL